MDEAEEWQKETARKEKKADKRGVISVMAYRARAFSRCLMARGISPVTAK